MDNSIISSIMHATLVAKLVLALLIMMSLWSWTIIVGKYFSLSTARKKATEGIVRFIGAKDLREAVQILGSDTSSPLYHVAQVGVDEYNRLREAGNSSDVLSDNVRRSLRQGVSETISRLNTSLSFLATAANTAPFIGLFGTVWGIMDSFHSIGQMKSASLAVVAPGISEALVATAVGLFVAIPATVGYNMFLSKLSDIEAELVNFAGVFLNRVQREVNGTRTETPRTVSKNSI
ncbi:protein TolQ [Desulfovibrio litoralis]|uniref:Cell division and transport-associated protein TolQ n=1 Tax=Desulfovibrio litoralis DSM 11393 TaxID=1121455 RepID=A0A1M7RWJ0_9BACT|nr:protein TolQ [Desulfovibrio litoralis]SHN50372.1 Cell division and transport-associated protein TolQ [Desulfovibrio litoralis DSM 11393]